jgi:uncharacterized protein YgiM (DUF1202 family)
MPLEIEGGSMSKNYKKDISIEPKTQMEKAVEEIKTKVESVEKTAEPLMDAFVSKDTTAKVESAPVLGIVSGCEKLRVRSGKSATASIITTLPKKTVVKILESDDPNWYKIQETKTIGYVMKNYITLQ